MPFLTDHVRDNGLNAIATGTALDLHICTSEPADMAGVTAASLGSKTGVGAAAPADAPGGGRAVTLDAVPDGAVSADGTATHWALVDTTAGRLLAANALVESQTVVTGNTFSLEPVTIAIPDAV